MKIFEKKTVYSLICVNMYLLLWQYFLPKEVGIRQGKVYDELRITLILCGVLVEKLLFVVNFYSWWEWNMKRF